MKVYQLIEILKEQDQNSEVILQKDAEGNGYSPLCDVAANTIYVEESTWSGSVYDVDSSNEDHCLTTTEWEEIKALPKCVLLYPIN